MVLVDLIILFVSAQWSEIKILESTLFYCCIFEGRNVDHAKELFGKTRTGGGRR